MLQFNRKIIFLTLFIPALALGILFQSCTASSTQASPLPSATAETTDQGESAKSDKAALGNASPLTEGQIATITGMGLSLLKSNPEAPGFTLPRLVGKDLELGSYRGKWVLLNFWATWCPPCRAEMPSIQTLWKDYESKGLIFLAISSGEEKETVANFIKENAYTFPILLDGDGQVGYQYSIESIPTTYLINPSGTVVAGVTGSHDWNSPGVREGLDSLLKK